MRSIRGPCFGILVVFGDEQFIDVWIGPWQEHPEGEEVRSPQR